MRLKQKVKMLQRLDEVKLDLAFGKLIDDTKKESKWKTARREAREKKARDVVKLLGDDETAELMMRLMKVTVRAPRPLQALQEAKEYKPEETQFGTRERAAQVKRLARLMKLKEL